VEILNGYNVKKNCHRLPALLQQPSSTSTRKFGGNYEVIHHTQLIAELNPRRQD